MFDPMVTNVLAMDRRRRLLHAAETSRLIKSTTTTAAGATPLTLGADGSARKTALGARVEVVVPKSRPVSLLGRKIGIDISGVAPIETGTPGVLTGP